MLKRTYESGSNKRKKTIAEAEARRVVTEKTKPITQFFSVSEVFTPEVATDPECRSRLQQDPVFFFRTWSRSQNCVKNQAWIRSQFLFFEQQESVCFSQMAFRK